MTQTVQTNVLADIVSLTGDNGGSTTRIADGYHPTSGYAVGYYLEREIIVSTLSLEVLAQYVQDNADLLYQDNVYLGTWLNETDNQVYLDVTLVLEDLESAINAARSKRQYAIFNLATFEEVPVLDSRESK